jgi:site-specific recombinase XerD
MRKLLAQARRNNSSATAFPDDDRVTRLDSIRASSPEYRSLRNLALVDLLFATGLRVGEVSSLNVQDFFMRESVFRVKGKGGRNRLAVVVDEETVRVQRRYLEARVRIETQSPALFLNSSGIRLTTQGIANVVARLREEAGIERHVTPHMLRHTVATLLLCNGVDIRLVQEFLGHASIATTQRYTHVTKEHMIKVLRKRHPSLGLRATARSGLKL